MKKIAIILSGCGNRDGSELQETLSLFLAIDRKGWQYQCFAPQAQIAVVSHLTGEQASEQRNLMVEAARVARGNVLPLADYRVADYDALLIPGGMGAAMNLCTYAAQGVEMTVRKDVCDILEANLNAGKPIGAMCIAPMVLAGALGSKGVKLTLGKACAASAVAEQLGVQHQECNATEVCVDEQHRIATTPAYMVATRISEIFDGGANLVDAIESLM